MKSYVKGLIAIVILLIAVATALVITVPSSISKMEAISESEDPEKMNRVQVEYLIHQEVNQRRVNHSLEPVEFDSDLRTIARYYSKQMAQDGFFSHYHPKTGAGFKDRYDRFDYECSVKKNETHILKGGENLARSYYDRPVTTATGTETEYNSLEALAEGVVTDWMNSPKHRKNILMPDWKREGIGVHVTENNTVYVTQNFC